jgi:hypothetical protein
MWGIPGVILAVPMLAVAKIICDRVRLLAAFGHFLEGRNPADCGGSDLSNCFTLQNLFCTNWFIPHFDLGLVVQNHVQQRSMDFQLRSR